MVHKRPFDDEKTFEVSSKHPRQGENRNQLVSFSETVFSQDPSKIPRSLGEDEFLRGNIRGDEKLASGIVIQHPGSTEDSNTSEEDTGPRAPFHVSLFPEYYNPEHPIRTLAHCQDIYCLLLNCPPRKPVPVGADHQADVPAWGSQGSKSTSNDMGTSKTGSGFEIIGGEEDENVLMGTCVIPMPDLGPSAYNIDGVGKGRSDCSCEDMGFVSCAKQHIMEAREKVKKSLGKECFVELGFCEMGEFVAEKWSAEEEQLFHKIVFSNPASMGKNFWASLSIVFPSRTKKDIVSYYFNVFMLRRRTEQNRCDSLNIDSDDDEWEGSDDSGDNELGISDEDEDSVIESPGFPGDFGHHEDQEDDLRIYNEDATDEACVNDENLNLVPGKDASNISETYSGKLLTQLHDKIFLDEREDHEVQDNSCTSSDGGNPLEGTQVKAGDDHCWPDSFNGLCGGGCHEYHLEPSDAKAWDAGYITCHKNKVDLLSTCSMIEEVFGEEP